MKKSSFNNFARFFFPFILSVYTKRAECIDNAMELHFLSRRSKLSIYHGFNFFFNLSYLTFLSWKQRKKLIELAMDAVHNAIFLHLSLSFHLPLSNSWGHSHRIFASITLMKLLLPRSHLLLVESRKQAFVFFLDLLDSTCDTLL